MNLKGIPVRCFLAQQKKLSLVKILRKKLEILAKIQSYIMGNDEWGNSKQIIHLLNFMYLYLQFSYPVS